MIQYIASGYNSENQRVILWRYGNYRYCLEIAGRDIEFEAAYEEALEHFQIEIGKIAEIA